VFQIKHLEAGVIFKETPTPTLQKQCVLYMNQNSSWESLIFVHILEEVKTQRIQKKKQNKNPPRTQKPMSQLITVLLRSKEASQGGSSTGPRAESSPVCEPALAWLLT